ncbi:hypothetical protein DFH07DRAFT_812674 [Mycena maculata]|uniref:Uncharacterized protein n=1 Tax=Mycena maculata TaxID=230809 RepID=A0AAD7NIP1_9AGAR|nr:hypothetical protein DFH07DRAFT_812674 [Mycena maculata]
MAETVALGLVGAAVTVGAAQLTAASGFTGRHESSYRQEMLETRRNTDDFLTNLQSTSGDITPDEEREFLKVRDEAIRQENEYYESIEDYKQVSWFNLPKKMGKRKEVRVKKHLTRHANHSLRSLNESMHSGSDTSSICAASGSPPRSNLAAEDIRNWAYDINQESEAAQPLYMHRVSPHTTPPLHLAPPPTPGGSQGFTGPPSPHLHSPLLPFAQSQQPKAEERPQPLYTYLDQLQFFQDALSLPAVGVYGPFVPQLMYTPHTTSDRRRYIGEVGMEPPIHFWVENPSECGIPLSDAFHSRVKRVLNRDGIVFEDLGPSVSMRLEWPGYRQWSRKIRTRRFFRNPGPLTRAELARRVAKCVQRFIQESHGQPMEDDTKARWRVGLGPNQIKLEDLVLVSIHNVSPGSWQPHLRLRRLL